MMMLPNFLLVGAEKAGTSTLATILAEHPDVFMCEPKEPRFFSHNWDKGVGWYESLFAGANHHKAIGEASPAYTWAPESSGVPRRIQQCLGDIRYLYIVRNPVERMISHYRHALLYRWIPEDISFEAALNECPWLENCSRYFYQIEQYLPYTSDAQWHVVVLEEVMQDCQKQADEVFQFLGLEEIPVAQLPTANITDEKGRPPSLFERLRPLPDFLPAPVRRVLRTLSNKFGRKIPKPEIAEQLKTTLMEELKPDVEKLSAFCGRDFARIWAILGVLFQPGLELFLLEACWL